MKLKTLSIIIASICISNANADTVEIHRQSAFSSAFNSAFNARKRENELALQRDLQRKRDEEQALHQREIIKLAQQELELERQKFEYQKIRDSKINSNELKKCHAKNKILEEKIVKLENEIKNHQ